MLEKTALCHPGFAPAVCHALPCGWHRRGTMPTCPLAISPKLQRPTKQPALRRARRDSARAAEMKPSRFGWERWWDGSRPRHPARFWEALVRIVPFVRDFPKCSAKAINQNGSWKPVTPARQPASQRHAASSCRRDQPLQTSLHS